jgi:NAD-dependent dihydropyrimidine dehydrogenase PreA subunit
MWVVSRKLVAKAAGLGRIGIHRNVIHPVFGNFILLGTFILAAKIEQDSQPIDYNPCLKCKLCVAACPVGAIAPDGRSDFSACYTHNYREFMGDSLTGPKHLLAVAVQKTKAKLASAQADSTFLRDDLARYRELLAQQVISLPEFERHETAYTTALEHAAAQEAQLAQVLNQLTYTELHANRNGVVTALAAGQAVVTLAQLDEKEIHFDVPEHLLAEIQRQQAVNVSLCLDDERLLKAKIREISSAAEPACRTYRVKATLLEGMDAAVWMKRLFPS